jgi:hypothetical protein
MMLCGKAAMMQASGLDGVAFDPFSFQQDGLATPEVDVSRGEVGDALVVSQMIVVSDKADLGFNSRASSISRGNEAFRGEAFPIPRNSPAESCGPATSCIMEIMEAVDLFGEHVAVAFVGLRTVDLATAHVAHEPRDVPFTATPTELVVKSGSAANVRFGITRYTTGVDRNISSCGPSRLIWQFHNWPAARG